MKNFRIAGVLIAYKPSAAQQLNWIKNLSQLDYIVVVNNTPTEYHYEFKLIDQVSNNSKIYLIENRKNLGIATALNQGINFILKNNDVDYIITLDQDSVLLENAIEQSLMAIDGREMSLISLSARKDFKENESKQLLREVKYAITSGTIAPKSLYYKVRFRDSFFIDQVDFDFCYNVLKTGYKIYSYNKPTMIHEMGVKSELNPKKAFESPNRFYYITRNSTVLLKEKKIPPNLYVSQIISWILTGFLFSKYSKREYTKSLLNGIKDGLRNHLGYNEKFQL